MHADLGRGFEIDLDPPSTTGAELLYTHAYVAGNAFQTNLVSYVRGNPLKHVDPLGLRECEIHITAGHFTPVRRVDEIGKYLERLKKKKPEDCPDVIAGVGCYPSLITKKIEELFPGRSLPGMPEGEGLLADTKAPDALEHAYREAVKHVEVLCEHNKCSSVLISISCTGDMVKALRKYGKDRLELCIGAARRPGGNFPTVFKCDQC